jgi:hypothetical protein
MATPRVRVLPSRTERAIVTARVVLAASSLYAELSRARIGPASLRERAASSDHEAFSTQPSAVSFQHSAKPSTLGERWPSAES